MKIVVESTEPTQEFLIDMYKHNVRITDARESPNRWLDLYLEGSEINLLKFYIKYWCEPATHDIIDLFKQQIIE